MKEREHSRPSAIEAELVARLDRLQRFFDSAGDLFAVTDVDTLHFVELNPAWEETLGFTRAELMATPLLEFVHPDDLARTGEHLRAIRTSSVPLQFETRLRTRAGRWCWLGWQSSPMTVGSPLVFSVARDVTDLYENAEAMSRTKHELEAILQAVPDFIVRVSRDGIIHYVNHAPKILGGLAVYGSRMHQWMPPEAHQRLDELLDRAAATGERVTAELPAFNPSGQAGAYLAQVVPLSGSDGDEGFIVVAQDITERKLESLARDRARRMMGLGRLAGGVAHDFNNVLTAIMAATEQGLQDSEHEGFETVRRYFEEIRAAADRGASLSRQLLTFARPPQAPDTVLELGTVIRELAPMLSRVLHDNIELAIDVSDEPLTVRAPRDQIEQVLVNLVTNARDALREGGVVTLQARRARKGIVQLVVVDNGVGMSPETVDHVFEPFFTTKGDAGSGLGMSICYGIVRRSGGSIGIESRPGQGTAVRVELPEAEAVPQSSAPATAARALEPEGAETLLLVEDEDLIRATLGRGLRRFGYRVLEARDGAEALVCAREFGANIDVLVTDVIMPKMAGPDLAMALQHVRPNIRVVYMSGYTGDEYGDRVPLHAEFLQKPFSVRTLAARIRAVLTP